MSKSNGEQALIQKIKQSGAARTTFHLSTPLSPYHDLWYVDTVHKLCVTFSPRGGCSVAFQSYLQLLGLLEDALQYHSFIHMFRQQLFHPNVPVIPLPQLKQNGYTFLKFIMNPYIRAVSIYRLIQSHNFSFRNHLKQLLKNQIGYYNDNDKYHFHLQYIEGEEQWIHHYIRIDKKETFTIRLQNGQDYTFDVSQYSSPHHGQKTSFESFCGDTPRSIINEHLPSSYKCFYDEEIKSLVETFYHKDLKVYSYTFDDF